MAQLRFPIPPVLNIEAFSGSLINYADYFNRNAIFGQHPDGRSYATQRPSIDVFEDASATISEDRGRGIYYWDLDGNDFFVNDMGLYRGSYGSEVLEAGVAVTLAGTGAIATATAVGHGYKTGDYVSHSGAADAGYNIKAQITVLTPNTYTYPSTGTGADAATATRHFGAGGIDKVYFFEILDKLIILDPLNNQGWTVDAATPTQLDAITDANFPPNQTPVLNLVHGGAVLDGYFFVGTDNGQIWNCVLNDPTTWNGLFVIEAQREEDGLVYVDKHKDQVVGMGSRSTEYFYNAGNPTESPLATRVDIFHSTGIISGDSAWREGDILFGVGVLPSGSLSVFRMNNFQLEKISPASLDSYLTQIVFKEDILLAGSGYSTGGRTFYCLTLYRNLAGTADILLTLVYDGNGWGKWETAIAGLTQFPLFGWTIRTGEPTRTGSGIMQNGDLVRVNDDFVPTDTLLASNYVTAGYWAAGYIVSTGGSGVDIPFCARTGTQDGGTNKSKTMSDLELVSDMTDTSQIATIGFADENEKVFTVVGSVDLSVRDRLTGLGAFRRRNIEVRGSFSEQVRLEHFETNVEPGDN